MINIQTSSSTEMFSDNAFCIEYDMAFTPSPIVGLIFQNNKKDDMDKFLLNYLDTNSVSSHIDSEDFIIEPKINKTFIENALEIFPKMRHFTENEKKHYNNAINKLLKPVGKKLYDLS